MAIYYIGFLQVISFAVRLIGKLFPCLHFDPQAFPSAFLPLSFRRRAIRGQEMREQKLGGHLAPAKVQPLQPGIVLNWKKYLEKPFMQFKLIISLTHSLMHEMTI